MFVKYRDLACTFSGALIAAALLFASVGQATAADVLSHRAIYNLSLAGSASGSKIEGIEGVDRNVVFFDPQRRITPGSEERYAHCALKVGGLDCALKNCGLCF